MKRLGSTFLFILTICCPFSPVLFSASNDQSSSATSRRLTIQEAVQMALVHSPEILLAEARSKRTEESAREVRSLNLPQAVLQSGYAYNYGFPMGAPSIFKISASQSILNSKNANLMRESKEAVKISQYGSDLSRNELASKTAAVYYQLYQARRIAALTTIRLEKTRKQQELIETSLGAGQVRPVDSIMAKTAVAAVQQQLLVAQEQAKVAEAELQEMVGIPSTTPIQTVDPALASPIYESDEETLFQQSIKSNPEILQAEAAIKVKEFHVAAEKGENYPRLDAVTEYSLFSRSNNYEDYYRRFQRNNYLIGVSVQIPIFNGFRTSARVAQSKHEVDEERYKLQRIKSNLRINIQHGLSALRIARGASELATGDLEATKEMIQVNSVLLESGRISMKEFEDSQLQLQQKEMAKLEADQILFQRKLELLRITGSVLSTLQ
jgi:outer membrane protein TolC